MRPVSVVIPNWNGADLLRANLPSLGREALDGDHEVIVVDDGSGDSSRDVLREEFPWVRLVAHQENKGFGEACLSGVRAAAHGKVLLLNTDVLVMPGFLPPLIEAFALVPELFSAAAVAYKDDGSTLHDGLRVPIWSRGNVAFKKLREEDARRALDESLKEAPMKTLFATGGHALYDRAKFLALGGFDPLYHPFYWEDVDLGYRAWRRGWPVVLVPRSRVIHREVGTIRAHFERRYLDDMSRRNRYLFTWRNITSRRMLASKHLVPLFLKILGRWLILDVRFYRTLFSALARLPIVLRSRRREREESVLSDERVWSEVARSGASHPNGSQGEGCRLPRERLRPDER